MNPVTELSLFGAFSCVVCQIRACFDVFHWFQPARALVLAALDLIPHFRIFLMSPGIGNLPYSLHCFYVLVERWFLESGRCPLLLAIKH